MQSILLFMYLNNNQNLQKEKENCKNPYDGQLKYLINQLFDQLKKALA